MSGAIREVDELNDYSAITVVPSRPEDLERFWSKVSKGNGDCWTWQACRDKNGYGIFSYGELSAGRAHRFSWLVHFGKIPEGICVLHRCDTPACVRPDHLFLGTHAENMADKIAKGRGSQMGGEGNPRSKLTAEDVDHIRLAWETLPVTQRQLAKAFGIRPASVSDIVTGRRWA